MATVVAIKAAAILLAAVMVVLLELRAREQRHLILPRQVANLAEMAVLSIQLLLVLAMVAIATG